jgi:cobalt-zinc-cadmium efflux system outer membrane protein
MKPKPAIPIIPLILIILAVPYKAPCQDEPPTIRLQDAVNMAMRMNPGIQKMEEELRGKSVEWKTALGLQSPEIAYAREGIPVSDPVAPYSEQRFTIQQNIDFPLTSYYRLHRISFEKIALERQLEALKKETTAGVKSSYTEILYANYIRKLRADAFRLSKELDDAVGIRLESGVGNYIDKLSSEVRLVQAENQQYEAERKYHEARYKLFSLIGLDPNEQRYDIKFADTLFTRDELIEQEIALYTLEDQPLYKSALASIHASDYGIREAKSGFLPGMRIGYLVQDFGAGYHFRGVEAGLTIPLWGMFNQRGKLQMAQSNHQMRLWDQKSVELDIKKKIELAWHSYDNSQVTIELYQTQLKGKSEQLLALTQEAYRLGQIDLLKLLEAQQLYLTSQENYLNALHDYYLKLIELEQYVNQELVY